MNKIRFLVIIFLIGGLWKSRATAQIHDFDSLINHNESFKQIAQIIGDTLDLFNKNEALKITIESDFKNLVKRKYKDEYQDAIFTAMFNDTVKVSRLIKIKPRGNMRIGACFFPPIKLNFPKKDAYIKQIKYFDKLKMVLDCKRGDTYEQYLYSEYYAYKIQNIITDFSLRVRMLDVTYIDTSGKYKTANRPAFLIESIDQLAERHNAMRIETKHVTDLITNRKVLMDSYLFQYLIGNTDWSIPAMHNIYLIKSKDPLLAQPYVIPYDFDYAGIVDAIYAVPDEQLGTESVRERVYRGRCLSEQIAITSGQHIINKKQEIYDLYHQDKFLSKSNMRKTISYLDEFFEMLENNKSFQRVVLNGCR